MRQTKENRQKPFFSSILTLTFDFRADLRHQSITNATFQSRFDKYKWRNVSGFCCWALKPRLQKTMSPRLHLMVTQTILFKVPQNTWDTF
jgi:hypothetical protein